MGIVVLLGHTGSGKDTIARERYQSHCNIKFTSIFKADFELRYGLAKGTCNDPSLKREVIMSCGDYKGLTVQDAMFQAFSESMGSDLCSGGYRWKTKLVTECVDVMIVSYEQGLRDFVFTDCRKPAEASAIIMLSELLCLKLNVFHIKSLRGQIYPVDQYLSENVGKFRKHLGLKAVEVIKN